MMEPRDVYKLHYQGAMGPEHLVSSPEEFAYHLAIEFDSIFPEPTGRLTEPVRSDFVLLRLNLRAFKAKEMSLEPLIPSLIETAQTFPGNLDELRAAWQSFAHDCQEKQYPNFDPVEVQQFSCWLEEHEYPAIHHSEKYRQSYHPAYRLISDKFIHLLGLNHAS